MLSRLIINPSHIASEHNECGMSCIAMILSELGRASSLAELRSKHRCSDRGMAVEDLMAVLFEEGVSSSAYRLEVGEMACLQLPAILHWEMDHYVVAKAVRKGAVLIADPGGTIKWYSPSEIERKFTGIALCVSAMPSFQKRRKRGEISILKTLSLRDASASAVIQTLVLSVVIQICLILAPYYSQLAVDEAIGPDGARLLLVLSMGFVLVAGFNCICEILRGTVSQIISYNVGWNLTRRLFDHMLRLPLPWFDRRKAADTLLRFDSIIPIRDLVSASCINGAVDGAMSIAMIAFVFYYSFEIGVVTVVAAMAISMFKVIVVPKNLLLAMGKLQAEVDESSFKLEVISRIQSIKSSSAESFLQERWARKLKSLLDATYRSATFNIHVNAVEAFGVSFAGIAVMYLAVDSVMENQLSIGAIFALSAYSTQFIRRSGLVIDQLISWRLTELHSGRISEIALETAEVGEGGALLDPLQRITARGLGYRFSPKDPILLNNATFSVGARDFVVVRGKSGAGKSTLMKVLAGLLPPLTGVIEYNGIPSSQVNLRQIREQLGIVLQDDQLVAGTLLENVTMYSPKPNLDRAWLALSIACVDSDVRSMPMGIRTAISESGKNLSAGQRQRILLARAFYKGARIYILDEATANIDIDTEKKIFSNLREIGVGVLLVTHREQTIDIATSVLDLR